jgi:hypothetical protein
MPGFFVQMPKHLSKYYSYNARITRTECEIKLLYLGKLTLQVVHFSMVNRFIYQQVTFGGDRRGDRRTYTALM